MGEDLHANKLYQPELSPWYDLANAIIIQAAEDYRNYRKLISNSTNHMNTESKRAMKRIRDFFLSQWYGVLSQSNGEEVLTALDKEVF